MLLLVSLLTIKGVNMKTFALAVPQASGHDIQGHHDGKRADQLMLMVLGLIVIVSIATGSQNFMTATSMLVGLPLLALGAIVVFISQERLLSRLALPAVMMMAVGLHIHVGMGRVEYHFGVFVTLALLLIYQDWRPIAVAAVTVAVQHIVTDRLQAAGFAVYCLSASNFNTILLHAVYVVIQAGVEIHIAILLSKDRHNIQSLAQTLGGHIK